MMCESRTILVTGPSYGIPLFSNQIAHASGFLSGVSGVVVRQRRGDDLQL